jgi:multiple sugar transport system ATP-binding protein
VALGRAIVRTPTVFLLDEPLSNLDTRLRLSMRTEIKRIQTELNTTTIYVTHDQEEAMTLGDRLVVLRDGAIQQFGAPLALYDKPANRFVAGFFGSPPMNFLRGRLEQSDESVCFAHGIGRIEWPSEEAQRLKPHWGSDVFLGIRPEHLRLTAGSAETKARRPIDRTTHATRMGTMSVRFVETPGDRLHVHMVAESGESVVACVPRTDRVSPGKHVDVTFDASAAHIFLTTNGEVRIGTTAD